MFALKVTLVTFWIVTFGTRERRYVTMSSHRDQPRPASNVMVAISSRAAHMRANSVV